MWSTPDRLRRKSKARRGSSLAVSMTRRRASRRTDRATSMAGWGAWNWMSGRTSRKRSAMEPGGGSGRATSCACSWAMLAADLSPFFHDLLLEGQEGVYQRFRPGRAARNVDVHGDDLVYALEDTVVAGVGAAVGGAGAHGYDPLGVRALPVLQRCGG